MNSQYPINRDIDFSIGFTVLAKEFGWTPEQVMKLTLKQFNEYCSQIAKMYSQDG